MAFLKKTESGLLTESVEEASSIDRYRVSSLIGQHFPELARSSIKVVKNDFLEAMFLLKKAELEVRNKEVRELLLIHVTSAASVESIVKDNFDWRRVTRGKFGLGTSFSDDASYANRYANYNIGTERAFIICRVLFSEGVHVNHSMAVPPPGFDTSVGNGNKVFVKFSDHEVLPLYVVFYKCDDINSASFAKLTYNAPNLLESSSFDSDKSDSSGYSVDGMDQLCYTDSEYSEEEVNGSEECNSSCYDREESCASECEQSYTDESKGELEYDPTDSEYSDNDMYTNSGENSEPIQTNIEHPGYTSDEQYVSENDDDGESENSVVLEDRDEYSEVDMAEEEDSEYRGEEEDYENIEEEEEESDENSEPIQTNIEHPGYTSDEQDINENYDGGDSENSVVLEDSDEYSEVDMAEEEDSEHRGEEEDYMEEEEEESCQSYEDDECDSYNGSHEQSNSSEEDESIADFSEGEGDMGMSDDSVNYSDF